MEHLVRWSINVNAEDSFTAVEEALNVMRDPNSLKTVFLVTDEHGVTTEINYATNRSRIVNL